MSKHTDKKLSFIEQIVKDRGIEATSLKQNASEETMESTG